MSLQKEYEQILLARIINNIEEYYENADIINSDLFQVYSDIYNAWYDLVKQSRYPTLTKMITLLPNFSTELQVMIQSIDFHTPIIELVTELEENRRLRHIDSALTKTAMKDTSDEKITTLTDAITRLCQTQPSQFIDGYTAAKDALIHLETKQDNAELPTGFKYLDNLTGGLQRSDLVIIAAETSQGKSSLALKITQSLLDEDASVAFISLEMTEHQLMLRLISAKSGIPIRMMLEKLGDVQNSASTYAAAKLHIADVNNNSTNHILGLIRSASIRYNIDVVVVDYLQLITDKSQKSREQEIGQTARSLKNIAKELNINVIALSQLSRPIKGYGNYPTLSRLRDSGQVEEAADLVVFIYRPESHGVTCFEDGSSTEGVAEIIIAKGRNYGTGKFRCSFEKETTRFADEFD